MHRADAYALLSREPARYRELGYDHLATLVGSPPVTRRVITGGETIKLEIRLERNDPNGHDIRIRATAYGPSTWWLERLDEQLVARRGEVRNQK
jgi:hypothetical protein